LESGFSEQQFEELRKWQGEPRDESNEEQNAAYQTLKGAYEATERWALTLQRQLFPRGRVEIRKRPTSQANKFLPYNWAKIYPDPNANKSLAYTVGIGAGGEFVVKLDTVNAGPDLRRRYEAIRGASNDNSPIAATLPENEGLRFSLEELVEWSAGAIEAFSHSYDALARALDLQDTLSDAAILLHFDLKAQFKEWRAHWPEEATRAFCEIARVAHQQGFDWWHTGIYPMEVRCGRKPKGRAQADRVLGYLRGKTPRFDLNTSVSGIDHSVGGQLDDHTIKIITELLKSEKDTLREEFRLEDGQVGLWPDQFGADAAEDRPRRFWVEKTKVKGRPDRLEGENALGRSLWSPQRSESNADIYANMREVRAGDIIFHLTDNRAITGISVAEASVDDTFPGVEGTTWGLQPSYRIQLRDFVQLDPPLEREAFFETEPFAGQLRDLLKREKGGLFYNATLSLREGAYLTRAPEELIGVLAQAYRAAGGPGFPHVGDIAEAAVSADSLSPYSIDDALSDLFLERPELESILNLWMAKKNIILQGPPGVGKSFAAQRLAFARLGAADKRRLGFVQFHQSYAYEDFVEGFRPTETGFELRTGKFVEFCRRAANDLDRPYVFIIDEINRGNLSKIFGELMLLIESDKRDRSWEMALAYGSEPFHVPHNVHLLGLMNTADRSLAVVDYALRRRFAFVELEPKLASPKFQAALADVNVSPEMTQLIVSRIGELNAEITADVSNLGPGFAIGHSFFCGGPAPGEDESNWLKRIIETELLPLLREYWFDAPDKVETWRARLVTGL
jgi:hypothetical protein